MSGKHVAADGGSRWVVVTGVDTGVGKTMVTAAIARALCEDGVSTVGLKPVATGESEDADWLQWAAGPGLGPFPEEGWRFRLPVAPWVAARRERRRLDRAAVVRWIRRMGQGVSVVLVEGAGGLLTPWGRNYSVVDIAADLGAAVLVVAVNRLGVINQARMAVGCLGETLRRRSMVVLTPEDRARRPDPSVRDNAGVLRELLPGVPVVEMPRVRIRRGGRRGLTWRRSDRDFRRLLAWVMG